MHLVDRTIPSLLDPCQWNGWVDEAVSRALHTALEHLENRNTHARLLFCSLTSAPPSIKCYWASHDNSQGTGSQQHHQQLDPGLPDHQNPWGEDREESYFSMIFHTGPQPPCPQGWRLSPCLFTFFTHDCIAKFSNVHINEFADNTILIDQISDEDETAYKSEVVGLVECCHDDHLTPNTLKQMSHCGLEEEL